MSQKSIILVVVLFALLVAGMFIFANLKQSEMETKSVDLPISSGEISDVVPYANITRITATHYYIDGTHTLVGELNMPTPCDLLEANSNVMESYPEQVNISFNVINNAEMCADVVTAQRFMVEADASGEASFSASFMGRHVELNLIPAAEGESPEDFEMFIKG